MDLVQTGLPLFYQQFWALVKKNMWLSWRSKRSTFVQLFSSFFFILTMFCIKKTWDSCLRSRTMLRNVFDPEPLVMPPIPPCEDKFFIRHPCLDFVWSGNESARIVGIVSAIMANNPSCPIPSSKVLSFGTTEEVDAWLYCNPMRCSGALHFMEMNASIIWYAYKLTPFHLSSEVSLRIPLLSFGYHFRLQLSGKLRGLLLEASNPRVASCMLEEIGNVPLLTRYAS